MAKFKKEIFCNGMTIKDLKRIIIDLPETDCDGEPYEVWIASGNERSSLVREICPFNDDSDYPFGSDIHLDYGKINMNFPGGK